MLADVCNLAHDEYDDHESDALSTVPRFPHGIKRNSITSLCNIILTRLVIIIFGQMAGPYVILSWIERQIIVTAHF